VSTVPEVVVAAQLGRLPAKAKMFPDWLDAKDSGGSFFMYDHQKGHCTGPAGYRAHLTIFDSIGR
jgi:hypothetical protein